MELVFLQLFPVMEDIPVSERRLEFESVSELLTSPQFLPWDAELRTVVVVDTVTDTDMVTVKWADMVTATDTVIISIEDIADAEGTLA
jgi:hypothetical protein